MQFLETFKHPGTNIEFTKLVNNKIKVIDYKEAIENKTDNIYFLSGVRDNLVYDYGRAKDIDITYRNHFVIDLDIRKNYEEAFGETCTDKDIIQDGLNIAELIHEEHKLFGQWSYIIFTGNGLHLYYIGDKLDLTKEEYSLGVEHIYKMWDNYWDDISWKSDHACKNIGRILRLPGTINQKNGSEVKILASQEIKSELVLNIKQYAKEENHLKLVKEEKRKKEILSNLQGCNEQQNEFYGQILTLPAYQIAQILVPEFPYDGKKNFKNKKGGFTGYFYNRDNNTIVNGGSRYFNWGDVSSGWNNFSLVKRFFGYSNSETFQFFKQILQHN